jgi:multiple sugar transport system substrate-binding protein
MKKRFLALFLLFVFILSSGFGCKTTNKAVQDKMKPVTLSYWRVYDEEDAFIEIINKYKALHPFVNVEYKKFRYEEYEKELLNALAEDRGPDIFSIPSNWLKEYQPKISPLPPQITMVYPVTRGTLKKETIPELRTTKSLTLKDLRDNFVDIVYSDAIIEKDGVQQIYGLPLYVDTLAMFYNPDLLNNAGITEAPKYWNQQFQQAVKKLSKQNNKGNLIQSGVAMGGSDNIERSSDVLALLMMQNGAVMIDGDVTMFHSIPPGSDKKYNPGMEALRFYTDFSNPAKEVYCWNSNLGNSLELFAQGSLAMMFGYSYHLPIIKSLAPKLNFAISRMPQIEGNNKQVNYANYWMEVVSNKSSNTDTAWDFLQFATAAEQVESYLNATKKPTALRALVNKQLDDLEMGSFAEQVLTAQSWYHGKDSRAAEKAFRDMIDLAIKGTMDLDDIINDAAKKVQQTLN